MPRVEGVAQPPEVRADRLQGARRPSARRWRRARTRRPAPPARRARRRARRAHRPGGAARRRPGASPSRGRPPRRRASSASASSASTRKPSPSPGIGPGGSMCSSCSCGAGIVAKVSITGPSARSPASRRSPSAGSPRYATSTTTNCPPRRNSGISGSGGTCSRRPTLISSSGATWRQLVPGAEHLAGALPRPQQHARVHLGDRVEAELQRRDRREAAAAAAQRPEELGLRLARRRAAGARRPSRPRPRRRCWRRGRAGGRARRGRRRACSRRRRRRSPSRPAPRARRPRPRASRPSTASPPAPARPGARGRSARRACAPSDQDRALQAERRGGVARALHRHRQPVLVGVRDEGGDVLGVLRVRDEHRRWSRAAFQAPRARSQSASPGRTMVPPSVQSKVLGDRSVVGHQGSDAWRRWRGGRGERPRDHPPHGAAGGHRGAPQAQPGPREPPRRPGAG